MALAKSQRSLKAWGKQKWRTKSGKKSSETGERYLPEKAIKALSSSEYAASTKAKRKEGANLKPPVKKGVNPRRISFAARFAGMKGPMKDEKGRPTRKALALRKWGFRSVESARNFANRHKKS